MPRFRLLVLLALLPGLLFSSGVSVRVCVHAVLGLQAGCDACVAEVSPCCGASQEQDGPSLSAPDDSAACCLDLEAAAQRLCGKERAAEGAAAPPPVLLAFQTAPRSWSAPRAWRTCERPALRASPAARGILPLRI